MAATQQINRSILANSLTVVAPDGFRHGPISKFSALQLADQHGLDLVLVSVEPPVAKLMDWGKHQFDEKKKAQARENDPEVKRRQASSEVKEITLGYAIAEHDQQTLIQRAGRFLVKGHRVRFILKLKGREMRHHLLAAEMLSCLATKIDPKPKVEKAPYAEGNRLIMILAP